MSARSPIEWTQDTWNPIAGCSVHSPGCTNCYAMKRVAPRLAANPATPHYAGTVRPSKAGPVFTGVVNLAGDAVLTKPLRWKNPRMIFVNSTSDLFHENVPDAWIDRVFAVMALCLFRSPSVSGPSTPLDPWHTFQILTKRGERMLAYMSDPETVRRIYSIVCDMVLEGQAEGVLIAPGIDPSFAPPGRRIFLDLWPLPNVWLGVSAEDQTRADERIPHLLATPAAVRFVSAEPLLGPIDLRRWMNDWGCEACGYGGAETKDHCPNCGWTGSAAEEFAPCPECGEELSDYYACPECEAPNENGFGPTLSGSYLGYIDQVIVGGESGKDARPTHPAWVRSIRDQCAAAQVPFFFKQWGEWAPGECASHTPSRSEEVATWWEGRSTGPHWQFGTLTPRESEVLHRDDEPDLYRLGKKAAGRLLDGVEHNGMPAIREVPAL